MKTKLLFPVFCYILLSCNETTVDLKTEEAAILKADSTWSALASESKDVDRIVSYFADDAVVLSPGQPAAKGKEALKKFIEESLKIPGFSISWKSSDLKFSPDGKLAYMYGENMTNMNDSTGNKISIPGRGYSIWRKEADGSWKCVVDVFNNPPSTKQLDVCKAVSALALGNFPYSTGQVIMIDGGITLSCFQDKMP